MRTLVFIMYNFHSQHIEYHILNHNIRVHMCIKCIHMYFFFLETEMKSIIIMVSLFLLIVKTIAAECTHGLESLQECACMYISVCF